MKTLTATLLLAASGLGLAQAPLAKPWHQGETLTGDWGGTRSNLEKSGITPFLFYDSILSANVHGGIKSDNDFAGQIYAGADFDLEKIFGWQDTTLKASFVNRHGSSLSDSVGGIYDPMTIYGGQVNYLYQLFLEKKFSDQWSFKFGRVSADTDFAKSPLYGCSLSTAINGPIRATLLEGSLTSFPYAVWGGRLKYNPSDEHQFQIGVYQTGPDQWDFTKNGLDFSFGGGDGVSVLLQYDWTSQIHGKDARVFVGAINSFRDYDNFDGISQTDFLFRGYAHAEVEVANGVKAFGVATYSAQDEATKTPLQISAGVNYTGLIPSRQDDHTFLFATYGQLSDKFGDSIGKNVTYECVYELGHRFQLSPSAYFQPSVQYIQNPSGTGEIDDAVVLGAWMGLKF